MTKKQYEQGLLRSLALDESCVHAIRALNSGTATMDQQRLLFDVLIARFCMIGGLSYDPENERQTLVNEGRRTVGKLLMRCINLPLKELIFKTAKGAEAHE